MCVEMNEFFPEVDGMVQEPGLSGCTFSNIEACEKVICVVQNLFKHAVQFSLRCDGFARTIDGPEGSFCDNCAQNPEIGRLNP